ILADAQREIYNTLRPVGLILHALEGRRLEDAETECGASLIDPELRDGIVEKCQDAFRIGFHAAESLRLRRRLDLAKAAGWNAALVAACKSTDSGSEFDGDLFGPKFRERFHIEAKHNRDRLANKETTKSKPKRKPYYNNGG